jgi:lipid-binding SYLF domain-containing protein
MARLENTDMKMRRLMLALPLLLAAGLAFPQDDKKGGKAAEKEAARAERLKIAADGLDKLYKLQPEARKAVEGAVGYAVFDISSIYVIMFVGQRGTGVLIDNASRKPTFMSSQRAGTGPGVGKQRVYQVFVFKSKEAMSQFTLAGGLGGDVGASVSTGTGGMVRSFNPSVDIYQVPESGMAVQASWGGTVYSVDKDLQ